MRVLFYSLCIFCSMSHELMAQSASSSPDQAALMQRFIAPKPLSYRAEVIFGPSKLANPTRILEVRNGLLTSSPAVPDAQFVISDQSKAISALLSNYQAQWKDISVNSRLANRPAQQLKLTPRDGWRYTRVLWLDEQTGVPLKTEIFRKNELIERIEVKTTAAVVTAGGVSATTGRNSFHAVQTNSGKCWPKTAHGNPTAFTTRTLNGDTWNALQRFCKIVVGKLRDI